MEVRNLALAIGGALAVHAFLAAAIVLYIDYAPGPTVTAELDLSSVELSFSDEKLENPTAVATLPPAARHEVPAPKPIARHNAIPAATIGATRTRITYARSRMG